MRTVAIGVVAGLTLVGAAVAGNGESNASWSEPVAVPGSRSSFAIGQPELVMTAAGAVVLWNQTARDAEGAPPQIVRAAPFDRGGTPGQARTVIGSREAAVASEDNILAVAGGRDVLVAGFGYGRRPRVAVGRSATGVERFHFQRFGRVPEGGGRIGLAQAPSGAAALTYRSGGGRGYLAVRRPGRRRFGTALPLRPSGGKDPAVAVNAGGDALVVWKRRARIRARIFYTGGRWGPLLTLGHTTPGDPPIVASLADDRRSVVGWLDRRGTRTIRSTVRVVTGDPAGRFSAPVRIDTWTSRGYAVPWVHLRAIATPDGRAVVAWTGKQTTRAAVGRGRTFAAPQDLGPLYADPPPYGMRDIGLASLTAGRDGQVRTTFLSSRSAVTEGGGGGGTVQSAHLAPGATAFAPTETVFEVDRWPAGIPSAVIDTASGRALIAWHSRRGISTSTSTGGSTGF